MNNDGSSAPQVLVEGFATSIVIIDVANRLRRCASVERHSIGSIATMPEKKNEKRSQEPPARTHGTQQGIRRELYFPTAIYFLNLDDAAELNAELAAHILAWRAEIPKGIVRSNVERVGAWHSPVDMHRRPEYHRLAVQILDSMAVVFNDQGYDPEYEPALSLMWANISPRYGFNRHHTHPGVLWSGVYYVRAPENSGRILFTDPRAQAHVIEPYFPSQGERKPEIWSEVYYDPIEGRMLLFPAWLSHEVEPNLAAGEGEACERISISFNVFQRKKGTKSDPVSGPIVRSDIVP